MPLYEIGIYHSGPEAPNWKATLEDCKIVAACPCKNREEYEVGCESDERRALAQVHEEMMWHAIHPELIL